MELIEGSETSADNRTPGKYPKEYIQYSKHGESLKSRIYIYIYIKSFNTSHVGVTAGCASATELIVSGNRPIVFFFPHITLSHWSKMLF